MSADGDVHVLPFQYMYWTSVNDDSKTAFRFVLLNTKSATVAGLLKQIHTGCNLCSYIIHDIDSKCFPC